MNDWKEVKDEADIEMLLKRYGNFHDCCLKEVHIVTKASASKELAMSFEGDLMATLLFQKQYQNPPIIELRFHDVGQFNFISDPVWGSIIYDATLRRIENIFYWAGEENWEIESNDVVWISGRKVFWREKQS